MNFWHLLERCLAIVGALTIVVVVLLSLAVSTFNSQVFKK